jgi:hypothetical protein
MVQLHEVLLLHGRQLRLLPLQASFRFRYRHPLSDARRRRATGRRPAESRRRLPLLRLSPSMRRRSSRRVSSTATPSTEISSSSMKSRPSTSASSTPGPCRFPTSTRSLITSRSQKAASTTLWGTDSGRRRLSGRAQRARPRSRPTTRATSRPLPTGYKRYASTRQRSPRRRRATSQTSWTPHSKATGRTLSRQRVSTPQSTCPDFQRPDARPYDEAQPASTQASTRVPCGALSSA